jgi:hypothetical protein
VLIIANSAAEFRTDRAAIPGSGAGNFGNVSVHAVVFIGFNFVLPVQTAGDLLGNIAGASLLQTPSSFLQTARDSVVAGLLESSFG